MRRIALLAATALALTTAVLWWLRAPATAGAAVVSALVDGATTTTVEAGSPLFVEVFLHGTRNAPGPAIGGWLRRWDQSVTVTVLRAGQSMTVPYVRTATPRETVTDRTDRTTVIEREASRAALDGLRRVFRLEAAVPPESTRQLAPGTYQLVVSVRAPWWQFWSWRGQARSSPVNVAVVNTRSSRTDQATSAFLYKTGQFREAARAAREWSSRDSQSIGARLVLGDALFDMGDRSGARAAWEEALGLAAERSAKEPPIPILARLDRLRRHR